MSTYLLINLLVLSLPLLLSFDARVHFYRRWRALFSSILISAAVFIAWDVYFTHLGVWGFNPIHLTGVYWLGLPMEEWFFFISVPYATVFIFDCLRYYFPRQPLQGVAKYLSGMLVALLILLVVFVGRGLYTQVTFISLALLIALIQFVFRFPWMGYFYTAYLLSLIPFLLVNGVLTGSFITQEVVWYNPDAFMGVRLFTIPLEDAFYGMMLLLVNVFLYHRFLGRMRTPLAPR